MRKFGKFYECEFFYIMRHFGLCGADEFMLHWLRDSAWLKEFGVEYDSNGRRRDDKETASLSVYSWQLHGPVWGNDG